MSDSVRPQRRQPTSTPLCRPWDSPGKNTGVACHFLLQCMRVKSENEVAQLHRTLGDHMDCSLPGSSVHKYIHKHNILMIMGQMLQSKYILWLIGLKKQQQQLIYMYLQETHFRSKITHRQKVRAWKKIPLKLETKGRLELG